MEKSSKIYIAGHRGLVGSAIVRQLEAKGYNNIISRTHSELDLTDTQSVASFFKTEQPDLVVLAAAKVGGIHANNVYRADFIYENLMIQNNVIHQSYKAGVKKLLFLGSTCIYPKNAAQPIKEEYLLTDALEYTNEPYAIAKIAGIKMCESYNLQYGTNFISAMPTNLYGPNDTFDLKNAHVLPSLLRKIHLGKALEENDWTAIKKDLNRLPIDNVDGSSNKEVIEACLISNGLVKNGENVSVEIWGTGTPRREFLWVEDMADACIHLLLGVDFKDLTIEKEVRNTHINLGTGSDVTIAELANLIKETIGFKGDFTFNTAKPEGTMQKLTDVTKINALGWNAAVDLAYGIGLMYNWYLKGQA